jgi:16S rRNA (uracil1498-N3)-methyltransferase
MWKRSRSVSPRGEGSGFQAKVRARMAAALEQSGSAWLPVTYPDATVDRAIASLPAGPRYVMNAGGTPVGRVVRELSTAPVTIAVGPEGGFDETEVSTLQDAGFEPVGLGSRVLRFETAGVVALAHVRAALAELEAIE